jgi:exodeoxyribonuclease-3
MFHCSTRGRKSQSRFESVTLTLKERILQGLHEGPENEHVRILQTVVEGIPIINSYVPQGYSINSGKYAFKLAWFERIRRYFETQLDPEKPAIWLGDLNVTPEPIDVYHPDRRINDVDFHIDARTAYKEAVGSGFVDVFRRLHPDRVQYTYWDYFRNPLERNFGWCIDHILATATLADRCRIADGDMAPRMAVGASEHTVVWAEFGP